MKILIITGDKCDDSELQYPYYRLLEEGFEVDIASQEKKLISAKHYYTVNADMSINDVCAYEYDGLLIPGGTAPEKLRQIPEVIKIVRHFVEADKPIAAICHGQQILISAKALSGKTATCYPGITDDLKNAGANYVDRQVVVDGNLVTSRRPEDLPYFMREFIKLFN
jgi:protease I